MRHSPHQIKKEYAVVKASFPYSIFFFYLYVTHELNQIGIKIDMYRQEYRFTPAFAFIQAV